MSTLGEQKSDSVVRTTRGQAKVRDGRVVVEFGWLDGENELHQVMLDVDVYAIELARDLCAAISEQRDSEGVV